MALRILVLEVSDDVRAKINSLHGVTVDDALDAIESVVQSVWDHDPDRGSRLYVWGRSGTRVIFVCLRPVDPEAGEWKLVTAYCDERR